MRIGIFSNCYKPLINGVVGAVSLLRQGFLEAGHEVYIFTPGFDDYVDNEEGIYRYPAVNLTGKVKYPIAVLFSPKINRILTKLELDIVHSHHPFVLGPLSFRLARRKKIPAVYTFHTQYDQYTHYVPLPSPFVKWIARRQVQQFCQSADFITTPAKSAQNILLDYGVTNPVKVIPNPIDLSRFKSVDRRIIRERYNLQVEKILINIGRIAPEKNLDLLLRSFRLMLHHNPESGLKLMIVGDGPELPRLKQLATEMEIGGQVIFTGMVETVEIPNYLAAADLFVMTSTSEVKPLAQLESLASGVPIVAVAAAGANDTINHGKNGILTPEEPQAFAEAVLNIIRQPECLKSFQENARQTAYQYSHSRIAKEYLTLFKQLQKEIRNSK